MPDLFWSRSCLLLLIRWCLERVQDAKGGILLRCVHSGDHVDEAEIMLFYTWAQLSLLQRVWGIAAVRAVPPICHMSGCHLSCGAEGLWHTRALQPGRPKHRTLNQNNEFRGRKESLHMASLQWGSYFAKAFAEIWFQFRPKAEQKHQSYCIWLVWRVRCWIWQLWQPRWVADSVDQLLELQLQQRLHDGQNHQPQRSFVQTWNFAPVRRRLPNVRFW